MNDMKQPLVKMLNLLSRQEALLVAEISEALDDIERMELSRDLKKVRVVLLEIKLELSPASKLDHLQKAPLNGLWNGDSPSSSMSVG